ncbi:MAG TPA: phytanoyl-CoA dioxygenase family protein [Acidimicrobiia bacterium]|nr:phytanoyl-CoA dioxygenase family protein [Acidimicrobiia bacterium]
MSVDVRTRVDRAVDDAWLVDPHEFFTSTLPAAIDANAAGIIAGLRFVQPRAASIEVNGEAFTLAFDDDRVRIDSGVRDGAAHVRLSAEQLADLVHDQSTFMAWWANGALDQPRGTVGHLMNWWLVVRAALDGLAIYTPGSVTFTDAGGAPLDLRRTFRPDDDPAAMHHFLTEAGFMRVVGLFDTEEMAAIAADMDVAAQTRREGDGRSWWARTADGTSRVVRMQGFDQDSAAASELLRDDRFVQLATLSGAGHRFTRRPENRMEALFKPIGVTEGISDIPWHKDCGLGRHSYECCGMTVGISVTGADETSGQLHALAGSHRALVWSSVMQPNLDLPDVPLPTQTGDITIHLSCTMHMAQPPTERERRVMYSGFGLPPLEHADPAAAARGRSRLGEVRESAPITVLDRHFKS